MKILGLMIGCFAVATTASAGVCSSHDCVVCPTSGHSTVWGGLALIGVLVGGTVGFKAFKRRSGGIVAALALLLAFPGHSFADDKNSGDTNVAPEKVTIAQLQSNPDAYAGKQVIVSAQLAGICASDGCLTLKDRLDVIEGLPPAKGFEKRQKVGSKLDVTGTVRVRGEGDKKEVAILAKDF